MLYPTTAIDKRPVQGRVRIGELGLDGDRVCDTKHHGGRDKAVYAYAQDEAQRWSTELGKPLPAGWFGENLRIEGLTVSDAVVGTQWRIGDAVLEVTSPRIPCATFQHWSGESRWVKRFAARGDIGAYLRVLEAAVVAAGDRVEVTRVPEHGVTIRELFRATDPARMARLLAEQPGLADEAKKRAERAAARTSGSPR